MFCAIQVQFHTRFQNFIARTSKLANRVRVSNFERSEEALLVNYWMKGEKSISFHRFYLLLYPVLSGSRSCPLSYLNSWSSLLKFLKTRLFSSSFFYFFFIFFVSHLFPTFGFYFRSLGWTYLRTEKKGVFLQRLVLRKYISLKIFKFLQLAVKRIVWNNNKRFFSSSSAKQIWKLLNPCSPLCLFV